MTKKSEVRKPGRMRSSAAWIVAVLITLATLSYLDRQVLSLLIGPIRSGLGISEFQISLLQGFAFASFYALFSVPLGVVVDRVQRRAVIAAGVMFWGLATICCGFAGNFAGFFLARICVGAGEATLIPAAYSLLGVHRHQIDWLFTCRFSRLARQSVPDWR